MSKFDDIEKIKDMLTNPKVLKAVKKQEKAYEKFHKKFKQKQNSDGTVSLEFDKEDFKEVEKAEKAFKDALKESGFFGEE